MATIHISEAEAARELTMTERIMRLPSSTEAVMDDDFASDVQAGIDANREPLNAEAWD